jgi:hypothetical protein
MPPLFFAACLVAEAKSSCDAIIDRNEIIAAGVI